LDPCNIQAHRKHYPTTRPLIANPQDLSTSAFDKLASRGLGVIAAKWRRTSCPNGTPSGQRCNNWASCFNEGQTGGSSSGGDGKGSSGSGSGSDGKGSGGSDGKGSGGSGGDGKGSDSGKGGDSGRLSDVLNDQKGGGGGDHKQAEFGRRRHLLLAKTVSRAE
jgi:hypothetical protein